MTFLRTSTRGRIMGALFCGALVAAPVCVAIPASASPGRSSSAPVRAPATRGPAETNGPAAPAAPAGTTVGGGTATTAPSSDPSTTTSPTTSPSTAPTTAPTTTPTTTPTSTTTPHTGRGAATGGTGRSRRPARPGHSTAFTPNVANPTTATAAELAAARPRGSGELAAHSVAPGSSAITPISWSTIIARAQSWVNEHVPYSETAYWSDANGTYREDCSGYVSMAWGLSVGSFDNWGMTTETLPSVATPLASLDDLEPGDMIDKTDQHVVLFDGWTDAGHSVARVFQEPYPGQFAQLATFSRAYLLANDYLPYRYDGVEEAPSGPVGSLVESGGFNGTSAGWNRGVGTNFAVYAAGQPTSYEGSGYAATNTATAGGSIYQDVTYPVGAGESFCATAEVDSAGSTAGASGSLVVWLLGGSGEQVSGIAFGPLAAGNTWRPASTCVTATTSHSDVRVQVYPTPNRPTVGVDAVDLHVSMVANGGFDGASAGWNRWPGTNFAVYAAGQPTSYEGSGYAATNTATAGGSIYQDVSYPVTAGQSFCATAEVDSAGSSAGASGSLVLWLLGGAAVQASQTVFGPLPAGNAWRPVAACVTATTAQDDIRVQFYPTPNGPTLAVDAVDLHASLLQSGGFDGSSAGWDRSPGTNFAVYAAGQPTSYEGSGYAATNTATAGGSIFQDASLPVAAGQSFCATAQVVSAGSTSGASGDVAVTLSGASGQQASQMAFGPLPAGNAWRPVSACVTARSADDDVRVTVSPAPSTPTLEVDAVQVG